MARGPARLGALTMMTVLAGLSSSLGSVEPAHGQSEPIYDQLVQVVKREYLSLGVLLQTVADFQFDRTMPGNNGFSVANFRIALSGELDQRFGYFLQTNFAGTPSILDARMYYRFSPSVRMNAGQFKAPFSYEFLTSASSIDFVNRAQAVTALAPGRQIGLSVGFESANRSVRFDAGAFNGNGTSPNGNDSDNLLYAGRVSGAVPLREASGAAIGSIEYGVNGGYSVDDGSSFGGGFVSSFEGDRGLFGADVRVTARRLMVATELLYAKLDPVFGLTREPWGGHATFGFMFTPKIQGLARLDLFEPDDGLGRRDWVVLGLNVWPTSVTEFQVNYIIDSDDASPDNHQLLINFQFGF